MIIGILIILFWMGLIPFCIGLLITSWLSDRKAMLLKSYLFGFVVYLAAFQVLIVSNMLTVNNFFQVCTIFSYGSIAVASIGVVVAIIMAIRKKQGVFYIEKNAKGVQKKSQKVETCVLWVLFGVVFLFQMIQSVRLTYPDGDDAYFVGTATYGANIPTMYSRIPYTGATTEFDSRHCLAPLPYVISFLSRMSGVDTSVIAHSVLPLFFIVIAYGIFYLIAREVCRDNRENALFMLLISVLLLFGNYSVYSMETFLMTRIRQGKASLGSFALPLGFYLLLILAKHLEGRKRDRFFIYFLIGCNGLVAALFTTMGNFIYPCMIGVGSLCICFSKKNWKKLIPLFLTCVPSGVMAVLYLIIS